MGDVGQGDVVAIWGCGAPAVCRHTGLQGMHQPTSSKRLWLQIICILLKLWLHCWACSRGAQAFGFGIVFELFNMPVHMHQEN